jgi:hypothetical protein
LIDQAMTIRTMKMVHMMAGAIMLDTNAENRRDNVLLDASASVTASRAECGR